MASWLAPLPYTRCFPFSSLPFRSTSKLATFLKMDEEALATHLLNIKHKTRSRLNNGNQPAIDGDFAVVGEVDFFINNDMVHVAEHVSAKRYSDHLVGQILKLQNLTDYLRSTPVSARACLRRVAPVAPISHLEIHTSQILRPRPN